ncbi:MAG: BamA/TamA family outer membrane protein [Flavobacteriaceae bacterium]|nr:BamA/TamA family outer membrane protein [Flavobacteriaceae bacterium]
MTRKHTKIIILGLLTLCFYKCSSTKNIAPSQNLLVQEDFFKNGVSLKQDLAKQLSVSKPNKTLLGIPLKLHIYNLAEKNPDSVFDNWLNKKTKRIERLSKTYSEKQINQLRIYKKKINSWLVKSGEQPSIFSKNKLINTSKRLEQYYKNKGFFNTSTKISIDSLKPQKIKATYNITTGEPFIIGQKTKTIYSSDLDSIYQQNIKNSIIQEGAVFEVENFDKERDRLVKLFRNNGIQNFQQKSIRFKAYLDSLGKDLKIPIEVIIKNEAKREQNRIVEVPYVIQKVKKINIYVENLNKNFSNYTDTLQYKSFTLYSDGKLNYKPKSLASGIFIKEGLPYSDQDRSDTYRYFSELQIFKYPSISFDTDKQDSLNLVSSIYLTPREPFSIGFDLDLSHSNIQFFGISLGSSVISRNIFNGTEILELGLKGTSGASKDLAEKDDSFFNIFEIGGDLKLRIPRMVFPFNNASIKNYFEKPKTNIIIGSSFQKNIGLDKQNFVGALEYQWSKKEIYKFNLKLFDLEFVNNKAISNYFNVYRNSYDRLNSISQSIQYNSEFVNENGDLIIPEGTSEFINQVLLEQTRLKPGNESYKDVRVIQEREKRLTSNNFILGTSFSFNKNNQENIFDENFSQFQFKIVSSGNLLTNLLNLTTKEKNEDGKLEFLDVIPSQFIKTEFNYIKHWSVGDEQVIAMRMFSGIAIPYGNSDNIPFTRSYFGGGANDNRAWKAYKLGPGVGENPNEFNEANFKIAINLEYRYSIFGPLKGAFFIDAGNIWNVFDDITNPQQRFDGFSDLSEIAIGTGFGLRYDFNYFVFRLDSAFKTYDPSQIKADRWGKQISLKRTVFNIGINYPF